MSKAQHFRVLDSFRGLGCILVAFGHWPSGGIITTPGLHLTGALVDFFFVLSGFVIAENYDGRIGDKASAARFMWLRVGRIYPLHVAALLLMVTFELASLAVAYWTTGTPQDAFTGRRNPQAITDHLGLVQIFGIHGFQTWNGPAWSIAAEMWTYLAFAVLTVLAGRYRYVAYAGAIVVSYLVLMRWSPVGLYDYFALSPFRCAIGFFAGVLVWKLNRGVRDTLRTRVPVIAWTVLEIAAAFAPVYFTFIAGPDPAISYVAPAFIVLFVLIFAQERGLLSRLLNRRALVYLGTLSFSVYLLHKPLITLAVAVCKGLDAVGLPMMHLSHYNYMTVGADAIWGDLLFIPYIAVVVWISHLSYKHFEEPVRLMFRSAPVAEWLRKRERRTPEVHAE